MVGFALVLVGNVLYNFPAAPINGISKWTTDALLIRSQYPWIIVQYLILLSLCALILLVFVAVCLGFEAKFISPPTYIARLRSRFQYLSKRRRRFIREWLWAHLLMSLILGVVVFDWYIFDGYNGLFWRLGRFWPSSEE